MARVYDSAGGGVQLDLQRGSCSLPLPLRGLLHPRASRHVLSRKPNEIACACTGASFNQTAQELIQC